MKLAKRFVLALAFASVVAFAGVSAQADHHEKNPCNPCDKSENPCAKKANPCDKGENPCAKKANPCDAKAE